MVYPKNIVVFMGVIILLVWVAWLKYRYIFLMLLGILYLIVFGGCYVV